ncbi:MAG: MerR family transcriptional regulator [Chloroflexi bacterium]|nr:MerR family transcriptional regulator [Chloroflexota bacterium]
MFRIAAFARLAGVSAKTLRAWDELGLFRPAWIDRPSGYRHYSPAQLPELRRILALRDLGLPLAEVSALVAGGADLRPVLERRRRELEDERREVERRLSSLEISVAMADAGSAAPDVVLQPVPPQLVATLAVGAEGDLNAAFYALETVVRDLGLRANRPPALLVHPAGVAGPVPDEVVVPLTGRFEARDGIAVRELPAGRVAAVIHRGAYDGLAAARAALEAWVAAASLVLTGRLRIVYLQFGAEPELRVPPVYVVERAADYVTELQLEIA